MSDKLSIVVPCYNEEKALPFFFKEIAETINLIRQIWSDMEVEIIYIDDGSSDNTLQIIKSNEIGGGGYFAKYVTFSRNFGKEAAMYAGLQKASGDYIVLMDADLQDPPALLPDMLKAVKEEGFDSAATRRTNRKGEPVIRSFFARTFYKLINKISKTEIVDGARDYRIMTRQMVDAILDIKEYNRFTKGIFGWVGFKTKWIEFENINRVAGETKWSFWKLLLYALDGIIAYSTAPLSLAMLSGISLSGLSFLSIIFIIFRKLIWGDPTSGWASLVCIILFLGGIQLLAIGIVGQYLAKTYLEVKQRPIYIIKEEG